MIYVAAGRHVYQQPFGNLRYVHGVSLETAAGLPIPPRPWQPKGCPDHPLRGTGFEFGPFSDVTDPASAETATGGFVHLIEADPASWWDTYQRYSLSSSNTCVASPATGADTIPGMTVCRSAAAASDRRKRAPFAAIVDPQHYAGPLGQPMAILCNPDMSTVADDHACEISYRLDQEIGLWYEFRTSRLPLSGLIAFDRELRRRIAEAEVPEYGWPALPSGRPVRSHK